MKKVGKVILIVLLLIVVSLAFAGWMANEPRPTASPSEEADALAKKMLVAVNDSSWQETEVVSWNFRDARQHLWDRVRHYDQCTWGDYTVWIDLNTQKGIAEKNGTRLAGEDLDKALATAWKHWCNDSFWFNPISKAFDEGVSRSILTIEGKKGLMVSYESGGVTPGDAYVWFLDENNRPVSWKMWVSLIPIGGIEVSWNEWKQLSTGTWVSTSHDIGPVELYLKDIKSGTLQEVTGGNDPFQVLN